MEPWNNPASEKESPSLGNLAHLESVNRDSESLEMFKDLLKKDNSEKSSIAEFLENERGGTSGSQLEDLALQPAQKFDVEPEKNDDLLTSEKEKDHEVPKDFDFEPPNISQSSVLSNLEDSEDLVNLEKSGKNDVEHPEESTEEKNNDINEMKLVDIDSNEEASTASDDILVSPEKGDNLQAYSELDTHIPKKPSSESRSNDNEATDPSFNSQPLLQFSSEADLSKEQESEKMLGDGLHVKETSEPDVSDNDEDFAPEPIPRDYPEIGVIGGQQFLAAFGLDTWFHPDFLHPKVESLVYWRDPKKSGIVFGGVLIILLSLSLFSLISVIAYTSLIALVAALAFRIYKSVMQAVQKTSEGNPFKEYLEIDLTLNPEKAREVSDVIISHVNKALTELRRLFLIEDVIDSIKFGILLWSLTYIGAWFNGLSLLIIAFVGLFTLPKIYENNQTQIDANINIVKTKINEVTEKIKTVIPLGKKTEETKNKNE